MTQTFRSQLDELTRRGNSASMTETIRKALALYDLFLEHKEQGGKTIFRHADQTEETLEIL